MSMSCLPIANSGLRREDQCFERRSLINVLRLDRATIRASRLDALGRFAVATVQQNTGGGDPFPRVL